MPSQTTLNAPMTFEEQVEWLASWPATIGHIFDKLHVPRFLDLRCFGRHGYKDSLGNIEWGDWTSLQSLNNERKGHSPRLVTYDNQSGYLDLCKGM